MKDKKTPSDIRNKEAQKQSSIQYLKNNLKPADKIYTMVLHRNRTGTNSVVAALTLIDGEIKNISGEVATAIGSKWDDRDGVWTGNQADLVFALSAALYKNEFVLHHRIL